MKAKVLSSTSLLICWVLALAGSATAATRYRIAPAPDTEYALFVDKTGVLAGKTHHLVFSAYSGLLTYDAEHPEHSSVEITVEAKSLKVEDDWVKDKDREKIHDFALSDKMLEADRFPKLTFRSTRVAKADGGMHFISDGILSVHGVAHPVQVDVKLVPGRENRLRLEGESRFRLTDFGLKPPAAALGTVGTKDEVVTRFRLLAQPESTR